MADLTVIFKRAFFSLKNRPRTGKDGKSEASEEVIATIWEGNHVAWRRTAAEMVRLGQTKFANGYYVEGKKSRGGHQGF